MTDNRTNEELAERLRQFAESQAMDFDSPYTAMMLNEVADRLVAAQGAAPAQPSNGADEDVLAEVEAERDAALARIAELEDKLEIGMHLALGNMKLERDRALVAEARIAEAANLHRPRKHWNSDREYVFVCDECTRINRYGIAQWPCPTAVSLGLNEGESE